MGGTRPRRRQAAGIWHAVRRGVRYAFVAAAIVAVVVWLNSVLLTLPWTKDIGRDVARVFTVPDLKVPPMAEGVAQAAKAKTG